MAVMWDPARRRRSRPGRSSTARSPRRTARGVNVVLSLYPPSRARSPTTPATPASSRPGRRRSRGAIPYVRDFIVGNEANQPRSGSRSRRADRQGGLVRRYAGLLAAVYDALKGVDPGITVIGVGLSPRGNDRLDAPSNVSHSPVRCIRTWAPPTARASARARSWTSSASTPSRTSTPTRSARGYQWPNAGLREPRPVQAGGLGRVLRHRAAGLPERRSALRLAGLARCATRYVRQRGRLAGRDRAERRRRRTPARRTSPVDRRGDAGRVLRAADPRSSPATRPSRSLLFFHPIDEPDLDRWQSGLVRADGTPRAVATTASRRDRAPPAAAAAGSRPRGGTRRR